MGKEMELVERLRAYVAKNDGRDITLYASHPSVLANEAADIIERLMQEVERCHARLEIDHYFKMGENDDSDLERVDIPVAERGQFPDGIEARDATIAVLEEDIAASNLKLEEMRRALEPFARAATLVEHVGDNGPAGGWVISTEEERDLIPRVKHLRAARKALEDSPS